MRTLLANQEVTNILREKNRLKVSVSANSSGLLEQFYGGVKIRSIALSSSTTPIFGDYHVDINYKLTCFTGSLTVEEILNKGSVAPIGTTLDSDNNLEQVEIVLAYEGSKSFQPVAVDLELDASAGSNVGTDPKFLAPIMGHVMGEDVAGEGNIIAGVIGAYTMTGTSDSDYPKAALAGVIFDNSTSADAVVMAVIDGDDQSGNTTRAGAAFGVGMFNNEQGSGVDYGLDLYAAGSEHYTGTGLPFTVDKAQVRMSDETCVITGAGVPVDYTDGDPAGTGEGFAGPGSMYIDTTNKKVYLNIGTKAEPTWSALAFFTDI